MLSTLVNFSRRALSMKLDVNDWHCNFINSSCANAFWQLNIYSCLFNLPRDICTVIIHEYHVEYAFRTGWNSTDSFWGMSCFALVSIPMRYKLREGSHCKWGCKCIYTLFKVLYKVMVGRFAGWFMNFPACPNWVSVFHSLTGGSCTTSLTFHDQFFPVAWFWQGGNVHCALYRKSYIQVSISNPICYIVYF